jgi:hypothetical protein
MRAIIHRPLDLGFPGFCAGNPRAGFALGLDLLLTAARLLPALTIGGFDHDLRSVEFLPAQGVKRSLGLGIVRHLDECEAARLSRLTIMDNAATVHLPETLESLAEAFAIGLERKIGYA